MPPVYVFVPESTTVPPVVLFNATPPARFAEILPPCSAKSLVLVSVPVPVTLPASSVRPANVSLNVFVL